MILAGSIARYPPVSVAETRVPRGDCSEGQSQVMPVQPGHPTGSSDEPQPPRDLREDNFLKAKKAISSSSLPAPDRPVWAGSRQEPGNTACTGQNASPCGGRPGWEGRAADSILSPLTSAPLQHDRVPGPPGERSESALTPNHPETGLVRHCAAGEGDGGGWDVLGGVGKKTLKDALRVGGDPEGP